MFARRGTYGWNGGWAGDAYLILHYAQLQPRIIYDETLARDGLDAFRVLVLVDCDVLTERVAAAVTAFQQKGGIVIGDENLAPRIKPDVLLPRHDRPKAADAARQLMLDKAAELRRELDPHYRRYVASDNPNVITRCRSHGTTDYVFALNDLREFGNYVGHHGLVMENGLPSDARITVRRNGGTVYDLVNHSEIRADAKGGALVFPVHLGPCDGAVCMVTERPIDAVHVRAPETVKRGHAAEVTVTVTDSAGTPVAGVLPVFVELRDPAGQAAEFSGHYGAKDGTLQLVFDLARNDTPGVWSLHVRELAAGHRAKHYLRLQ